MEGQTNVLLRNSEEVLEGLKELQLFSDQSLADTSASKPRFHTIDVLDERNNQQAFPNTMPKCGLGFGLESSVSRVFFNPLLSTLGIIRPLFPRRIH